jgi:hypothetical protein
MLKYWSRCDALARSTFGLATSCAFTRYFRNPSQELQEFPLKRYINVIEGSRSPPDRCCSRTLSEARYRIRNLKKALLAPGNFAWPPAIRCTAGFSRSIPRGFANSKEAIAYKSTWLERALRPQKFACAQDHSGFHPVDFFIAGNKCCHLAAAIRSRLIHCNGCSPPASPPALSSRYQRAAKSPDFCRAAQLSPHLGQVSAAQQMPLRASGRVRRISGGFDLICQPHGAEARRPGCPDHQRFHLPDCLLAV